MSNNNDERQDLNAAYSSIHNGIAGAISGVSIFARQMWNTEMRFLQRVGLMPLFRNHWWLFIVVGCLLLAFVMPLGVAFTATALAAGQMDPKAENDFVVPLREKQTTLEDDAQ